MKETRFVRTFAAALSSAALFLGGARPAAAEAPKLSIPFAKTTLDNGLTVIYHEDHSVPTVVVNVIYAVGSRSEAPKRTGFAHLFEHLMFMGTRRAPTKMFDAWMEQAGGWNNATTSEDFTDYFDVGPKTTLPMLLWLEADRLQELGQSMTLDKLNAQRDVVRNERRQSYENRPYGNAELKLPELLYPEGHPYHHPVIGSHADLEAAGVEDVKAFFARYYDPANASLVVAGDFQRTEAEALVKRYFGAIKSHGKPVDDSPTRAEGKRITQDAVLTIPDDVQLARTTLAWTTPKGLTAADADLDLAATLLAGGKGSRLYKLLVVEKKLAQSVSAAQNSGLLESHFEIEVDLRDTAKKEEVERIVLAELEKLANKGPLPDELTRAVAGYEMAFVSKLESVRERAALLNAYQMRVGRPDYVAEDLGRYRAVTASTMQSTVKAMLAKPKVVLRVEPKKSNKSLEGKGH
ncbi:MAG: pitrilysin family protein [Polyangiaceae bacterium]